VRSVNQGPGRISRCGHITMAKQFSPACISVDFGHPQAFAVTAIPAPAPILQLGGIEPGYFGEASGVALDSNGNIYVADRQNRRLQKFDSQGNYLSQFPVAIDPMEITVANGTVYIAGENGTNAVTGAGVSLLEYDESGNFITGFGGGGIVAFQSIAVDPAGNEYVVENTHGDVQKFSPSGTLINNNLGGSSGAAIATDGNYLYLSACAGQRGLTVGQVQKFDFSGNLISQWSTSPLTCGVGIAVDSAGDIRIAGYDTHQVLNFTNSGTLIFQTGSIGQGPGQFYHPTGVAVDAQGHTLAADAGNSRVQILDGSGNFLSAFGKSSLYGIYNNIGLWSTQDGHIDVVDTFPPFAATSRFSTFDSQGNLTFRRYFSDVLPTGTNWPTPTSLALGPNGNIYVDFARHPGNTCASPVIAEFNPQLTLLTTTSSGCDVGAPTFPTITVDTLGLVYLNEGGDVKVFDPNLNLTNQFAPANGVNQGTIAVDSQGIIYLPTGTGAMAIYNGPGNPIGFVHGFPNNNVATGPDRSLFATDQSADTLSVYPPVSTTTAQLVWNLPYYPNSVFVDQSKVYVVGEAGGALVNPVAVFVYSNLFVSSVTPPTGGDTGTVTVTIGGRGFQQGATATLRRPGQADINAGSATFTSDGTSATAEFNLTGVSDGAWDVVVTNPDGSSSALTGGFVIQPGAGAHVWAHVLGPDIMGVGQSSGFAVSYGNSGDQDAILVPLILTGLPEGATGDFHFAILPAPDGPTTPQADELLDLGDQLVLPLLVPIIPAHSSGQLSFSLTVPRSENFTLGVLMSVPWMDAINIQRATCDKDILENWINYASLAPVPGLGALSCLTTIVDESSQRVFNSFFNYIYGGGNEEISMTDVLAKSFVSCADVALSLGVGKFANNVLAQGLSRASGLEEDVTELFVNRTVTKQVVTNAFNYSSTLRAAAAKSPPPQLTLM
jgi:hypothetical protein